MELPRRQFLRFVAAAAVAMMPAALRADPFPARPITLVVPIAAGGAVDTAARIVAEKLQEKLQQPVVVENRPGAGSMIGTAFVAKAPRDGYFRDGDQFRELIVNDHQKYGTIIREAGIHPG